MVFCSNCGTENDDGADLCKNCHKKLYSTRNNWEVKFVIAVILIVVGGIGLAIYFESNEISGIISPINIQEEASIPDQSGAYLPTVTGENISTYKSSCSEIDLNNPLNNLRQLSGKKIKTEGELVGVMQNMDKYTNIQIKTPNLSLYPYIVVSYSTTIPYSIGDKLEVYGELENSAVVDNKEVPFIKASYIEKVSD